MSKITNSNTTAKHCEIKRCSFITKYTTQKKMDISNSRISQRKKKKFSLSVNKQEHEWLKENYRMDLSDFEFEFTNSMLTSQLPGKRKNECAESPEAVKKRREELFPESFSCFEDTQTLLSGVKDSGLDEKVRCAFDEEFLFPKTQELNVLTERENLNVLTERENLNVLTERGKLNVLTEREKLNVLTEKEKLNVLMEKEESDEEISIPISEFLKDVNIDFEPREKLIAAIKNKNCIKFWKNKNVSEGNTKLRENKNVKDNNDQSIHTVKAKVSSDNSFDEDIFVPITQILNDATIHFEETKKLLVKSQNGETNCNKFQENKNVKYDNEGNTKLRNNINVINNNDQSSHIVSSDNVEIEDKENSIQELLDNARIDEDCINNTFDDEMIVPITQELLKNKMPVINEGASNSRAADLTINEVKINRDDRKFGGYENALKKIKVDNEIKDLNKVLELAEQSIRLGDENPWPDDSILANALINMSVEGSKGIGNYIKEALIENARKNLSPEKLFNTTIREDENFFRNYGSFYGLPDSVKDLIKQYKGIDKLYEWQDECLNLPAVNARKNLVYALPTSGGKTLVAEILILREIICRRKNVIFVLPFVAIVQEKVWALSSFAVALEFLIEEYAGGKGNYPPRKRRRKNSVYIATIEKALGLMNSLIELNRTDEIGLIVVDELHLVGDRHRGSTLEEFLTKVKHVKDKIQVVGMSATIGNLQEICAFLDADVYSRDFRPVELVEYVKCGEEIARVESKAVSEDDILIYDRKVDYQYPKSVQKLDPDHLGGLVMEVVPKGSCLIFCRSKQNCENVAMLLCKILPRSVKEHKTSERELIRKVLKEEGGSLCKVLRVSIAFGIAYHHSGLTAEERRVIEEGFRQGVISVICCTSTLAAGVNLPAQRVIIRNPYIGRDFINLSRYKQMVGRAGRAGFGEKGESIVICTPQELPRVRDIFKSPMDVALSAMPENDGRGLQQLILSCISLKIANTKVELEQIASQTLLSIQKDKLDVNIKKMTRGVIKGLFKKGALQVENEPPPIDGGIAVALETTIDSVGLNETKSENKTLVTVTNNTRLEISKMGRAAIKGGLDLSRAHMLYEDLLQAQFSLVLFTGLHLMYLVTPYDISEQITPSKAHYYTLYSQLGARELQTASVVGLTEAVAVKMLNNKRISEVPDRVLNRLYVTLMLYDLWNEMPLYDVAAKYEVNRGLIQNLMTAAATFASNVFHFCEELEEFWAFSLLLKGMSDRLSHCCVKELAPLMNLPSVKQNRAKQLYQAGYKTLQSIAKANPEDLVQNLEYMSRKLANQLIAAAKLFLLEKVENLREEAEDVLEGVSI